MYLLFSHPLTIYRVHEFVWEQERGRRIRRRKRSRWKQSKKHKPMKIEEKLICSFSKSKNSTFCYSKWRIYWFDWADDDNDVYHVIISAVIVSISHNTYAIKMIAHVSNGLFFPYFAVWLKLFTSLCQMKQFR